MILKKPVEEVFIQLTGLLDRLPDQAYLQPCPLLSGASIGQHMRHIIELFQCLVDGYGEGVVNYEKRKRDYRIESDRDFAAFLLRRIFRQLDRPNKAITLEAEDYQDEPGTIRIPSNFYRELAYNLEHTIHHMALVRVGVEAVTELRLPEAFGVAYATIKYRQLCAQ